MGEHLSGLTIKGHHIDHWAAALGDHEEAPIAFSCDLVEGCKPLAGMGIAP